MSLYEGKSFITDLYISDNKTTESMEVTRELRLLVSCFYILFFLKIVYIFGKVYLSL